MHPVDAAIMVSALGLISGLAIALTQHLGQKQAKAFEVISQRLENTEKRLDRVETELSVERERRIILRGRYDILRMWALRAYTRLLKRGEDIDEPPLGHEDESSESGN